MRCFLILLLFCSKLLSQSWVRLPFPPITRRDDGVAVTINNKIYFGTGLQVGFEATKDFVVLDPLSLAWTTIPNMPDGAQRQYACSFTGTNCFYVFGGDNSGASLNSLYKFDIITNSWQLMAPKPGNGLVGACCFTFGNKAIIAGGKLAGQGPVNNEVWEYNISTNTWAQLNNFSFGGRWRASATVLNGKGYFMLGIDQGGLFKKEFFEYNPANDTWTKLADLPLAKGRAYAALQALNNKLVLFAGYDADYTYYNDVWFYNPNTQTWTQDISLPSFARKGGMCAVAYDNFYYSCGIDKTDERTNETWMIDVPLGVTETRSEKNLHVFPNPCEEKIFVEWGEKQDRAVLMVVENLHGQEIGSYNCSKENVTEISTENFTKGIYVLKIYSSPHQLIATKKIIKH